MRSKRLQSSNTAYPSALNNHRIRVEDFNNLQYDVETLYNRDAQTFEVDCNRTDQYIPNGSKGHPYKNIQDAVRVINALTEDRIAYPGKYSTGESYKQAVYTINVAPGIYPDNISITRVKNLTFKLNGSYITGNIAFDSGSSFGTADAYYSRLEFIGVAGSRPEKGAMGRLSGTFTGVRANDSLIYVSFSGIDIAGDVAFNTHGTWIVSMHNCMLSARMSCGNLAIALLETTGNTIITGHLAASADAVTAISLYSVDNCVFDQSSLINISNAAGSRITNSTFHTATHVCTITGGNINIDANSYKSLIGTTTPPTLAGATVVPIDGVLTAANQVLFTDGTASLPSISFVTDPNTGMFSSSANCIGFATNGSERWIMNASGAFSPLSDNANDIGSSGVGVRNIYARTIRNMANIGTAGVSVTAVENGDGKSHVTTLTITSKAYTIGDNQNLGIGSIIYTLPAGAQVIESSYISVGLTATDAANAANTPEVGLGTTIGTGAITALTTTMEDIFEGDAMANCTGTAYVLAKLPTTSSLPLLMQTGGTKDIYLNFAAAWSDNAVQTATVSGTVVLKWTTLA